MTTSSALCSRWRLDVIFGHLSLRVGGFYAILRAEGGESVPAVVSTFCITSLNIFYNSSAFTNLFRIWKPIAVAMTSLTMSAGM